MLYNDIVLLKMMRKRGLCLRLLLLGKCSKCSDVLWYGDTFGVMHLYSYTLYHPISSLYFVIVMMFLCSSGSDCGFNTILLLN